MGIVYVNKVFARYRDELDLPGELGPHCLRHSYVTHQFRGRVGSFVRAVGWLGVSSDYKNVVLRRALDDRFNLGGNK